MIKNVESSYSCGISTILYLNIYDIVDIRCKQDIGSIRYLTKNTQCVCTFLG